MATVYFQGTPCHTSGMLPAVGTKAPEINLTSVSLQQVTLKEYEGKRVVLNIFPSLDTPVCGASVRRFNAEAAGMENTVVICVSEDLPFAMQRFCTVENIQNVVAASAFRSPEFGADYGVMLVDGPLKGLLARAVVVVDELGNVIYSDLVEEITHEPDYAGALNVLKHEK